MKPLLTRFPRLMTPAEVREALGIDQETLRELAVSGGIRFTWTPGHARRYYADAVEALVRAGGVK